MTTDFAQQVDLARAQGRELAESIMVDTCVVTRPGVGTVTFDNTDGQYTYPVRVTVYAGKCRIQVTSLIANSSSPQSGERQTTIQGSELQLPVAGTDTVSVNDVIEITAAPNDAALVGRKFTVVARHEKTQATSRRLRVEEATG